MGVGRTRRLMVAATVTIASVALIGGGYAYGTGVLSRDSERPGVRQAQQKPERAAPSRSAKPRTPAPKPTSTKPAAPKSTPKRTPKPEPPKAILKYESRGSQVREVESRLVQLDLLKRKWVDGYLGTKTTDAVRSFQARQRLPKLGYVDRRTLDTLRSKTRKPTRTELYPPTENVPGALDPRCRTGRAICADKTSRTLRWVVDGKVRVLVDARFGAAGTPTREGAFTIQWKARFWRSTIYESQMPYSMFFAGGQAVHYSSDFRAVGFNGASHGCVNVRDKAAIARIFSQARVGDKVIVYRS